MGLEQRTLSVPALVVMIIAASAPLTVVAGGVTTNYAVTGMDSVPLSFVILGIILLIFSIGYTAMSQHIPNAGAFYAYIAGGLGQAAGVGAAMVAVVSYNLMQIGIYGLFGFAAASFASGLLGSTIPWWVMALVAWILVGALGMNRVDFSVKILGFVVALEFLVVIVYDAMTFAVAPEAPEFNAAFNVGDAMAPGMGAVMAFSIAAFMGFESGTIYNEEVKDPKRTARSATLIAVTIIAVFYAFSAWAVAVGEGQGNVAAASAEFGPDLIFVFLGAHAPGWFVDIANLLFITSLFAALLAFHNVVARYFYSMGRGGALPKFLAKTSRRTHAPVAGSQAQSLLALLVIVVFAVVSAGKDPIFIVFTMFTWMTNSAAFGLVLLMALTSFAVCGYFARNRTADSVLTRVIAPIAAGLALSFVFVQIVINFDVLIGLEEPGALPYILQAIVIVPGILGFLLSWWVRKIRNKSAQSKIHETTLN
ncbi:amino acid permease [Arthrobacter sp. MYb229]|uniref:APC family permease n=1 Tax=unclassified Arthrobacter TaxID=235627 RepID=UPI000CFDBF29|nr:MULTISPECIES: APC family permease [unclassified Arthrobacter]PRA05863.1 amino acid permease [Arthrobacter sp. MYb229]PRB52764.1 amino acid permease [Arthrobacter sp. MYb216]